MGHDQIYSLLVDKDDISWKTIILDLVRTEQMNPWDVDVSLLSKKYLERIKQLKEADLSIGGKVVLAAAILLRIKSTKLVGEDMDDFDRLLAGPITQDEFYDSLEQELQQGEERGLKEEYALHPRVPQARRRKVSVYDLVRALEKALEVKHRRVLSGAIPELPMPKRMFDVTQAITAVYAKIKSIMGINGKITFKQLVRAGNKTEMVYTFIPLLHLRNDAKIELDQEEAFKDITITLTEGNHAQN